MLFCFFFQAEDGIRDLTVTGVQTCALPICGDLQGAATAVAGTFPQGPRFGLPAAFPQTGQDSRKLLRRRRNMHEASRLQPVCAVRQGHCEDAEQYSRARIAGCELETDTI